MTYRTILCDIDDQGVAQLVLNRPEKLNAMNGLMFWELVEALEQLAEDDRVRALLLTGAGDKAFSAGADFWGEENLRESIPPDRRREFDRRGEEFLYRFGLEDSSGMMRSVYRLDHRMFHFPKPVVSAVNGMAFGVAWCLALNADLVCAREDARLSFMFIRNAIGASDMSTTFTVPRSIGLHRAKELMMLGEEFTPQRALEIGLINRVWPASRLLPEARALAARFAAGPAAALSSMKQALNKPLTQQIADTIDHEIVAAMHSVRQAEFQHAVKERGAKRNPFPGFEQG